MFDLMDDASPSARSQRGLDWLNFFVADVQTGFGPFVSVYLATHGWTQSEIGLALTVGGLAAVASQIPGGALVDAVKAKRVLIAGALALIAAGSLIFAFWPSFIPVLAAEILHGSASSVVKPALAAVGLGLVGHGALSGRLGRNHRYNSFGNALTAAFMGLLGHFLSKRSTFFAVVALCVPAGFALGWIRGSEIDYARARSAADRARPRRSARLRDLARHRSLLVFAACLALFQFANASVLPLAGEQLAQQHEHESDLVTAALVIVPQVVTALIAAWVARRADDWGRKPLLLAGFTALAVRTAMFTLVSNPWELIAIQLLGGLTAAVIGVMTPLVIADLMRGTGR
jgi:MFS family permease